MGLGRRLWNRVREFFTSEEPPPAPPPPPPPSPPPTDYGDFTPTPSPEPDLPRGWKFEGLYYGDRPPSERRVINQDPSDYEVATATDIIVSYTDALGTVYKTVHGAKDRAHVGKLISRTIMVVSPPR